MKNLGILFAFLSFEKLQGSVFNLESIEEENLFNGSPIITASITAARAIGVWPNAAKPTSVSETVVPNSSTTVPLTLTPVSVSKKSTIIPVNNERPAKKSKKDGHNHQQNVELYIQAEIAFNGYKKPEKKVALKRVLELIAANDYNGFLNYENEFKEAFGNGYTKFKRGQDKVEYMMHYIIRFGATNLLNLSCYIKYNSKENSEIEEAFENLIATKPLDIVLKFIQNRSYVNKVSEAISKAIQKRYPDLHFLDYFVFEICAFTSDSYDYSIKIFEAKSEEEKFANLTFGLFGAIYGFRKFKQEKALRDSF